jgi:hypothetical protein
MAAASAVIPAKIARSLRQLSAMAMTSGTSRVLPTEGDQATDA